MKTRREYPSTRRGSEDAFFAEPLNNGHASPARVAPASIRRLSVLDGSLEIFPWSAS